MELNTIRTIRIRATSEGVNEAATGLKSLAGSQDAVAVASDRTSKSTLSAEAALKRLQLAVDPAYKAETLLAKAERELTMAREQGLISLARQNELLALSKTKFEEASLTTGAFAARLEFLKGVLETIGIFAAFEFAMKMHEMIDSVVHGASEIVHVSETLGVTTRELQQLQFAASEFHISTETMNSALEKFSKGLGAAAKGSGTLHDILKANHVTLSGDLKTDLLRYADLIQGATDAEQKNYLVTVGFGKNAEEMGNIFVKGGAGIAEFADQADRLGAVIADDNLQKITELDKQWNAFAQTLGVGVKSAIIAVVLAFADLQKAVADSLGGPVGGFLTFMDHEIQGLTALVQLVQAAAGALNRLSEDDQRYKNAADLSAKFFGPAETAARAKATGGPLPRGDAAPGSSAHAQFLSNAFSDPFGWTPPPKPTVTPPAPTSANAFESAMKAAEKATSTLQAQTRAYGEGVGAAAAYVKEQELLNAAAENSIKLTPTQIADVHKLADAYGALVQKQAEQKALGDLQFQRQTMFMSQGESGIAGSLRGIYGDSWQSHVNGAIAAQMRLNEQLKIAGQLAGSFATTFFGDLQQGKSVMDALTDSVKQLSQQLFKMALDAAIQALLRQLMMSLGGGRAAAPTFIPGYGLGGLYHTGGVFEGGNVIPFSRGGLVDRPTLFPMANGMGLMGEAGPEAVMPLRRGPDGRLGVSGQQGGGGTVVEIHNHSGGEVSQQRGRTPDGRDFIKLIIGAVKDDYAKGGFDDLNTARFGAQPLTRRYG